MCVRHIFFCPVILLMDTWRASASCLLMNNATVNRRYKYLFKSLLSLLLGMSPEVEFLDQMVILCLTFSGLTVLCFIAVIQFYIWPALTQAFQFFYILANIFFDPLWLFIQYEVGIQLYSFCMWVSSCPYSVCWKDFSVPIKLSWDSCQKSVAFKCISGPLIL